MEQPKSTDRIDVISFEVEREAKRSYCEFEERDIVYYGSAVVLRMVDDTLGVVSTNP